MQSAIYNVLEPAGNLFAVLLLIALCWQRILDYDRFGQGQPARFARRTCQTLNQCCRPLDLWYEACDAG